MSTPYTNTTDFSQFADLTKVPSEYLFCTSPKLKHEAKNYICRQLRRKGIISACRNLRRKKSVNKVRADIESYRIMRASKHFNLFYAFNSFSLGGQNLHKSFKVT